MPETIYRKNPKLVDLTMASNSYAHRLMQEESLNQNLSSFIWNLTDCVEFTEELGYAYGPS